VQLALVGLDGIKRVRVLVPSRELEVTYDPQRISSDAIADAVRRAPAAGESGNYNAVPLPVDSAAPPTP
jgi:copper chaperone CopZ